MLAAGPYMDSSHKYNQVLKAGFAAATCASLAFLFTLTPDSMAIVTSMFGESPPPP